MQVLKNNPHVSKLIEQPTDSVKTELLGDHIDWLKRKHHCDRVIDFSESIEVSLSQHPRSPEYKLPKAERFRRFNRNFYEYSFEWAKEPWTKDILKPELFFEDSELREASKHLKPGAFNILVGMSGSGTNKVWPWTEALCGTIAKEIPDAHMITVGDLRCQLIEPQIEGRVTNLSGNISMRQSMALTSLVDLVISPDTGLLHASGCYNTPKIGLLGHNTIECITKHFTNDYSVEADSRKSECAPCLYLIYNMKLQCPVDPNTGGAYCMSKGIEPEIVFDKVKEVYAKSKERF